MKINGERESGGEEVELESTAEAAALPQGTARLPVRDGKRWVIVKVPQIDWIQADDNYSKIWLGSHCLLLREAICRLERQLQSHGFARISRFTIVNLDRIAEFTRLGRGQYGIVLSDGRQLKVSRGYTRRTRAALKFGL